jgi:NAD(P)-dependent dehydrogenase (short-subunit alcohol dehydrogenase family)
LKSLGISVVGCVCHVSKAEDRLHLIDVARTSFPGADGIDILISNAAVSPSPASIVETSPEMWDKLIDVNLKSSLEFFFFFFERVREDRLFTNKIHFFFTIFEIMTNIIRCFNCS